MQIMTILEIGEMCLTPDEDNREDDPARSCLISLLGIMRSLSQREYATPEGVLASLNVWIQRNGSVTEENVKVWLYNLPDSIKNFKVPVDYIKKYCAID